VWNFADLMTIGKQAYGRSDLVFDKHRPAFFRLFADYVIDFVAGDRAPAPLVALGGGSSVINVYPGVTDFPADKAHNGTFADGQTATAVCKAIGPTVHSNTAAGERDKQSGVWLRVRARRARRPTRRWSMATSSRTPSRTCGRAGPPCLAPASAPRDDDPAGRRRVARTWQAPGRRWCGP
jgi:hypothetical protein